MATVKQHQHVSPPPVDGCEACEQKTYTPEQFERLPKWAQTEIERLTRDVEYYQKKFEVGPEDSDTFRQIGPDSNQPLGNDTIQFYLDKERSLISGSVRMRVDEDHKGRRYIDVNGGDSLIVRPYSSNGVRIYSDRL